MTSDRVRDVYPKDTKWIKLEFPLEEFVGVYGAVLGLLTQKRALLSEGKITGGLFFSMKDNTEKLERAYDYMRLAAEEQHIFDP